MPRIRKSYKTTLYPGSQLKLHDLSDLYHELTEMKVPIDARLEIKTDSPDRPGEMTQTTITATWYVEVPKNA